MTTTIQWHLQDPFDIHVPIFFILLMAAYQFNTGSNFDLWAKEKTVENRSYIVEIFKCIKY